MSDKPSPGERLYTVLVSQGSDRAILARPFKDLSEDKRDTYAKAEAEFAVGNEIKIATVFVFSPHTHRARTNHSDRPFPHYDPRRRLRGNARKS